MSTPQDRIPCFIFFILDASIASMCFCTVPHTHARCMQIAAININAEHTPRTTTEYTQQRTPLCACTRHTQRLDMSHTAHPQLAGPGLSRELHGPCDFALDARSRLPIPHCLGGWLSLRGAAGAPACACASTMTHVRALGCARTPDSLSPSLPRGLAQPPQRSRRACMCMCMYSDTCTCTGPRAWYSTT